MDFLNVLRINCEALGPLKMWGPWERRVSFVNGQLIARPFARIDKLGLKSHQIRRRTKSCSQECNTIDTAGPNVWCWLSQSSLSCVSGQMAKKQSHPPKVNHSVELTGPLPLAYSSVFNFAWWKLLLKCRPLAETALLSANQRVLSGLLVSRHFLPPLRLFVYLSMSPYHSCCLHSCTSWRCQTLQSVLTVWRFK